MILTKKIEFFTLVILKFSYFNMLYLKKKLKKNYIFISKN